MTARMLLPVLSFLGPCLVGGVMLFAGLAKALDPKNFVRHLKNLRIIRRDWLVPTALAFTTLQWTLGAALLVSLWPRWLLPTTSLLLFVLAAVGYWGTVTGRTEDCGCYNDILTVSPLQSLLLDISYIGLLVSSWWYDTAKVGPGWWKPLFVLSFSAAGGLLTYMSFYYEEKHNRPLLDLSPLKPLRRWNSRWLCGEAGPSAAEGEKIVVFLGATCPHCKSWIKILNVVHRLVDLPEVIGAVVLSQEELASYVDRADIRFPVVTVEPWVLARLARGFTPTAVVVKDGVIQEKWVGRIPRSFAERIRSSMARVAVDPTL